MTSQTLAEVRRQSLASLIPPPRLKLSEWIESHLQIPEGVSALPGPVRLWPYQRDIADAINDPALERVTLVKPVRVGFSTLLTAGIASYVANEPAPILLLLPTEMDCRDFAVTEIQGVFDATPALKGLISADASEGARNTLLHKRFPGGSLKIVAAKAPRNLRRDAELGRATRGVIMLVDPRSCAKNEKIEIHEARTICKFGHLYADFSPIIA